MATVQENINLGVCGAGSGGALGFNTDKGCADLLKAAHSIWLMSPSAFLDPTAEFDAAYVKTLQKAGQLVVIKGVTSFAENGSDDAIETLEDDTQIRTNKGKYKFTATFTKGLYYQRALTSVEGFGSWRTIIVDVDGNIVMTQRDAGGARGFNTGEIMADKMQFGSNSTALKQSLTWQLLDRFEVDESYVMFQNANLTFDPRQVESITQAYISLVNAPANGDTTITAKIVVDRGRKQAVPGAVLAQFLSKTNGATIAPTASTDTAGTYALTVAAQVTAAKGELSLYDSANNTSVIEIPGDGLYKSNTVTYTVV